METRLIEIREENALLLSQNQNLGKENVDLKDKKEFLEKDYSLRFKALKKEKND